MFLFSFFVLIAAFTVVSKSYGQSLDSVRSGFFNQFNGDAATEHIYYDSKWYSILNSSAAFRCGTVPVRFGAAIQSPEGYSNYQLSSFYFSFSQEDFLKSLDDRKARIRKDSLLNAPRLNSKLNTKTVNGDKFLLHDSISLNKSVDLSSNDSLTQRYNSESDQAKKHSKGWKSFFKKKTPSGDVSDQIPDSLSSIPGRKINADSLSKYKLPRNISTTNAKVETVNYLKGKKKLTKYESFLTHVKSIGIGRSELHDGAITLNRLLFTGVHGTFETKGVYIKGGIGKFDKEVPYNDQTPFYSLSRINPFFRNGNRLYLFKTGFGNEESTHLHFGIIRYKSGTQEYYWDKEPSGCIYTTDFLWNLDNVSIEGSYALQGQTIQLNREMDSRASMLSNSAWHFKGEKVFTRTKTRFTLETKRAGSGYFTPDYSVNFRNRARYSSALRQVVTKKLMISVNYSMEYFDVDHVTRLNPLMNTIGANCNYRLKKSTSINGLFTTNNFRYDSEVQSAEQAGYLYNLSVIHETKVFGKKSLITFSTTHSEQYSEINNVKSKNGNESFQVLLKSVLTNKLAVGVKEAYSLIKYEYGNYNSNTIGTYSDIQLNKGWLIKIAVDYTNDIYASQYLLPYLSFAKKINRQLSADLSGQQMVRLNNIHSSAVNLPYVKASIQFVFNYK